MKRYGALILLPLILLGICSCATTGGRYLLLVQTMQNAAWQLQNYCAVNKIESHRADEASALISAGREKLKAGNEEAAYADFDLAVLMYRLAVAEHEFVLSRKRLKIAESDLTKARAELDVYRKELEKLKLPMIESNL